MIAELPPISGNPINGTRLLSGKGPDQKLTIAGTVDWGLMTGTVIKAVVSTDPIDAASYVVRVSLTAPESATLSIPAAVLVRPGPVRDPRAERTLRRRRERVDAVGIACPGHQAADQRAVQRTPIPIVIGIDPIGGPLISLDTSAIELPRINDVLAAFGDKASAIQLPATINDLANFSLQGLFVGFDPAAKTVARIGVQIGKDAADRTVADHPWFLHPEQLRGRTKHHRPAGNALVGGLIEATGHLGSVDIGVSALHPASGGWKFSGYLGKESGVSVGELASGLAGQFGVTLPKALSSFTLNDFEFSFDTETYDTSGHFSLDFEVNGTAVDLTVAATLTYDKVAEELHPRLPQPVAGRHGHLRGGLRQVTVDLHRLVERREAPARVCRHRRVLRLHRRAAYSGRA